MLTVLGIPNCDTVRKARRFLDNRDVAYTFRDVRAQPLTKDEWQSLVSADSENKLVNTRSPSFRKTGYKAADLNDDLKVAVLCDVPTAMKRPVVLADGQLRTVGFNETDFEALIEAPN